jgi:hypothetical protein
MNVLTEAQKSSYEDEGYLLLEGFVGDDWLDRLNRATAGFIEQSRELEASSARILVEPSHTQDNPRLRRIPHTVNAHPDYEAFGLEGPLIDIAEDLLGPNIRFHHSKLNFKWHSGGEAVEWHQDIQFWPHTNYSPLTIGVYLEDVTEDMGPMGIVRGSHKRELFELADEDGNWTGSINPRDLEGHRALIPEHSRLPAERVGTPAAAPPAYVCTGGCPPGHRTDGRGSAGQRHGPRRRDRGGSLRRRALPHAAGLQARRIQIHLLGTAAGTLSQVIAQTKTAATRSNNHALRSRHQSGA